MRISIVGAYGYTGRLICAELENAGIPFSIFGRNEKKIEELKEKLKSVSLALALDMRKEEDVQLVIDESDLIVNCAGPFTEEAQLLTRSAAKNGKKYLDITGELGFVRNSYVNNHAESLKNKACLVHGCAFESLVADLIIHLLVKGQTKIKSIRSFYWFNQKKFSPGTRITMKLSKFRALEKISDGAWSIGNIFSDQLKVHWSNSLDTHFKAVPYPLPEIAYAYWNYEPKKAESFILLTEDEVMFVGGSKQSDEPAIDALDKLREFKPSGPTKEELNAQRSILAIEIIEENGTVSSAVVNARNMYQTTALAIRLCVEELIQNPAKFSGVISPAKIFDGKEEQTLKALNVEYEIENKLIIYDV